MSVQLSQSFENFDFENLVMNIQNGKVLPIIGPEIFEVMIQGNAKPLYSYLAENLANKYNIQGINTSLGDIFTLAEVVEECYHKEVPDSKVMNYLTDCLKSQEVQLSPTLLKLAKIESFKVFITTVVVNQLSDALEYVWRKKTDVLSYKLHAKPDDLNKQAINKEQLVVYHLFGSIVRDSYVAFTQEDILEYCHNMAKNGPNTLYDELREKHLLFIGVSFPDWLYRFFLRGFSMDRLSNKKQEKYLAYVRACENSPLTLFLEPYKHINLYREGSAQQFVDKLYHTWISKTSHMENIELINSPTIDTPDTVFICFYHKNKQEAEDIANTLNKSGIKTFIYTKDALPGEDFEEAIKKRIEEFAVFIPIISEYMDTLETIRAWFRWEWDLALKETLKRPKTYRYIRPIMVGKNASLPQEMKHLNRNSYPQCLNEDQFIPDLITTIRTWIQFKNGR